MIVNSQNVSLKNHIVNCSAFSQFHTAYKVVWNILMYIQIVSFLQCTRNYHTTCCISII